jgi:hypothetical protein
MYILIDVIALFFVLGFTLYGLKAGFFASTIDFALVAVCFVGSALLAYFTVTTIFTQLGWVDEISRLYVNLLGNSKIEGGQAVIETVANALGIATLTLITFIVYGVILHFVRKVILKLVKKLNKAVFVLGFIDKLLGLIVNFVISAGIVLLLMAVIRSVSSGGVFLVYFNEAIRATDILSLLYDINPLNALFS